MPRRKKQLAQAPPASTQAPVIGNPDSLEFHVIAYATGSCQWQEIAEPLEFTGVDAALDAGLKACGHCANRLDVGERTDRAGDAPTLADAE